MKPFNLEEAKAGKKVCTSEGFPVRIIDFNFKGHGEYKLIGVVEIGDSTEVCHVFKENGTNECHEEYQLFMVGEKHEAWVNLFKSLVYNEIIVGDGLYKSENDAKNNSNVTGYVATAKIEWEE